VKHKVSLAFLFILTFQINSFAQDLTKYVDPFIGTAGHGHTYPGATMPFGMVQISPDTRVGNWDACSGYHYSDSTILGFSQMHLSGTGAQGLGDILLMPTTGKIQLNPGDEKNPASGYRSKFSHASEKSEPGYYSVILDDHNIKVELTATVRAGFHKYIFPQKGEVNLIIDLMHRIQTASEIKEAEFRIINDYKIEGMRRTSGYIKDHLVYFAAEFSKPIIEHGIQTGGNISQITNDAKGDSIKTYLKFKLDEKSELLVKVGISTVDYDGAWKNLEAEIPGWNFDKVKNDAKDAWNKQLSKIIVKGNSEEKKKIFYTALYHSSVVPNIYYDVDRRYRGRDRKVHTCCNFDNYTALSIWDTFRATHPLYVLIDPKLAGNLVKALLAKYDESGMLPQLEYGNNETNDMIGYHSLPVIADAYFKGLKDFDVKHALKAMINSAYNSNPEMKYFKELGFIPSDKSKESVSKSLEYTYDDWNIYRIAKSIGDEKTANEFLERAKNYINLYDGSIGFFKARTSVGDWVTELNPSEITRDYTEGNAWQYSLFAPHDINGLINLHGGKSEFISHVDKLFTFKTAFTGKNVDDLTGVIGQYAHGNEPSHHMAYVYNFVDQPWKTQALIHQLCKEMYTTKPDGLIGNEDCGQMSSWFNFSSMGFYPFCPGTEEYQIGTPLFEEVKINLGNGKVLCVKANNLSDENYYIQSVTLNGKKLNVPFFKHSDIINGGELIFTMGNQPNERWGKLKGNNPYSLSKDKFVSVPYVKNSIGYFAYQTKVELGCFTQGAELHYTLDGTSPTKNSVLYTEPFTLADNAQLRVRAFKDGYEPSPFCKINPFKAVFEKASDISNSALVNGVDYKYYEGNFISTLEITKTTAKKSGNLKYFTFDTADRKELMGFIFQGYIYIPEEAIYSFYSKSDDGSVMFVDDKLVVNNDGHHSATRAISSVIALSKGYHPYRLLFFNKYMDAILEVGWSSKNIPNQKIPAENLFREK
jgi:predicted alpha-1,2-mannosidase